MGKFHFNERSQEVLPINRSEFLRVGGFMLRNPNRGFKVEKMKWTTLAVQKVFWDLRL